MAVAFLVGYTGKRGWEKGLPPVFAARIQGSALLPGMVVNVPGGRKVIIEDVEVFTKEGKLQSSYHDGTVMVCNEALIVKEVWFKGEYV